MIGLCLASGVIAAHIATTGFTLAWMHSIEKIRWEEDWRIGARALTVVEGRIRGSGAGMEPPDGAELVGGVWHYRVDRRLASVDLAHSPYTTGYELCVAGRCRPLASYLPGLPAIATIRLRPCSLPDSADAAHR